MKSRSKFKLTFGLFILLICSVGMVSISGLLNTTKTLTSQGSINNSLSLGIYSDSACTTSVSSIAWGSLSPGGTITRTVYVKNLGTMTMTLQCIFTNWTPTNSTNYITLAWNRENTSLAPKASIAATFTMTVSSSIHDITNFSVDINVNATQV